MTLQEKIDFTEELSRQYLKLASKHLNDPDTSNMYRNYSKSLDGIKASLKYLEDIQTIIQDSVK